MLSKGSLFGKHKFLEPKKEIEGIRLCAEATMPIFRYFNKLLVILRILVNPIRSLCVCGLRKRDNEQPPPGDEEGVDSSFSSSISSHIGDRNMTFRDDEEEVSGGTTAATHHIISGGAVSSGGSFQPPGASATHDTHCLMCSSCTCTSCMMTGIQQQSINTSINATNSSNANGAAKVAHKKAGSNVAHRITESRNPFVFNYSIRDSLKERRDEEISKAYYPEQLDYYRLKSPFHSPNASIYFNYSLIVRFTMLCTILSIVFLHKTD